MMTPSSYVRMVANAARSSCGCCWWSEVDPITGQWQDHEFRCMRHQPAVAR